MSTANQFREQLEGSRSPLSYEFGPFVLDTLQHALLKEGKPVPITPKTYDTLLVLVQNSGRMLSKEELMKALWPDSFVEESNLTQQVSMIRRALGESPSDPRYVVTVPSRGYRFIAAVELAGSAETEIETEKDRAQIANASSSATPVRTTIIGLRERRIALAGIALTGLSVLAFSLVHSWHQPIPHLTGPPRISSIAVLPLKNLSNDPEQEYFVEGMTDELITDLAQLPGLRVISRTSSMHYKDTPKTAPEIGRELNVDAIVEGTVLRAGSRVRIRTQLIYAPADQHVWAEAYERDLKDVLTLQADLARDVAAQIRHTLTSQQESHLTARSLDPEAHELYLKGRYFWNKRDDAGFNKAREYFERAIAKDPNYPEAYAGLADTYALLGEMPEAKVAAEKAVQLDPDLAEAHASLGLIAPFLNWNWADSKQHFQRAIALNAGYATAHHWYGEAYLMPMGRTDDAIAEIRQAQALDPLSAVITTDLGKDLYLARRYDEAVAELRRALELDPGFVSAHNWLSDTYLEKGMFPEAIAELEKTKPLKEERTYIRQTAYLYARMGRLAEARTALAKSLRLSQGKPVSLGAMALTYAALGDKEEAFLWLDKAYAAKSSFMTTLKYWPAFDSLRSDPRFADLVRRVGLSQ